MTKPFRRLCLVAGVPKAGTTSLDSALRMSSQAVFPEEKEPHYLCAQINRINKDPLFRSVNCSKAYLRQFRWDGCRPIAFDCDPLTFQDESAVELAGALAEELRVVVVLRNPVDRFISHYVNDWRECIERRSLTEAVKQDLRRFAELKENYLPYTWHSFYAPWIRMWRGAIGSENLLFIRFEEIRSHPLDVSRRILAFTGLSDLGGINLFGERENPAGTPRNVVVRHLLRSRKELPNLRLAYLKMPVVLRKYIRNNLLFTSGFRVVVSDEDHESLRAHFEADCRECGELLGWNLGPWMQIRAAGRKVAPSAVGAIHRNAAPRCVFAWANFGPYHFARLNQTRLRLGEGNVWGVEIAGRTLTYAWREGSGGSPTMITLLPGRVAEGAGALTVYFAAMRAFRRIQPDVVFVPSYWPASSLAILLAARSSGARTVMMNESHEHTSRAIGWRFSIKRRIVRSFDSALVGGQLQRRYFESLGIPPQRIFDGYDSVDNAYFESRAAECRREADSLRERYGLPVRYFLNVGRMEEKKNLCILIAAFAKVRMRKPEQPQLVLVGSGQTESALRDQCVDCGLNFADMRAAGQAARTVAPGADVLFYGFRQVSELPVFYGLATAFVLPSLWEEWGLVVNEAMASGLPVIVSKNAGCAPDLVCEGETGFVYDPESPDELAVCLERLGSDAELARQMGERARVLVRAWGLERFAQNAERAAEIAMAP